MSNNKFYTPDGFTDQLPEICAFKREAEGKLRGVFAGAGYKEIETPGVEYCDIYTSTDLVKAEDLFKFCDQKGRLLCARYDGTVPAVRFAANLYKDEPLPLRLFYIENMYRFNQMGGGKQSGFTQGGVEFMGACGTEADSEVLALAIESALSIGIKDLQISLGQVRFFEGLTDQFGLTDEARDAIRTAIQQKDSVTIENTAREAGLNAQDTETLLMLIEYQGGAEVIDQFRSRVKDSSALSALDDLKEILEIMDEYGYLKYITVDLGLIGSEDYYTGVIFKGYTYEVGFPIIGGGRYDNVAEKFGRKMEAVGFSLSLTLAITALMRQGLEFTKEQASAIVGYDRNIKGARAKAIALARALREEYTSVILDSCGMTEEELDQYSDLNNIPASFFVNEGDEE
ncbi:ATP phosphoribosyltransferase regulatory subunit [Ruminococcaceae bacterium YRB3002]|nr:ATP phosphoribosyltransferase regulatory subunit [Ruminococcaceae bacterium YRB3002]